MDQARGEGWQECGSSYRAGPSRGSDRLVSEGPCEIGWAGIPGLGNAAAPFGVSRLRGMLLLSDRYASIAVGPWIDSRSNAVLCSWLGCEPHKLTGTTMTCKMIHTSGLHANEVELQKCTASFMGLKNPESCGYNND